MFNTAIPHHSFQLTRLYITNCNLTTLPSGFLKDLPVLDKIYLKVNKIYAIEAGAFQNLSSVTEINMMENHLTVLSAASFVSVGSCSNLLALRLDTNHLTELPRNVLKLDCLGQFLARSNKISKVAPDAFASLPLLQNINLSLNKITKLGPGTFNHSTHFMGIDLSGNHLEMIDGLLFANGTTVSVASFPNNRLTTVEPSLFDRVMFVQELDLSGNKLTSLPETFSKQTKLHYFFCMFNSLRIIQASNFSSLSQLETLNLIHNNISRIESKSFASLKKIKTIYLQENPTSNVTQDALFLSNETTFVTIFLNCTNLKVIPTSQPGARLHCVGKTSIANFSLDAAGAYYLMPRGYVCSHVSSDGENSFEYRCTQCDVGTISREYQTQFCPNFSKCINCPAGGYYQDRAGAYTCQKCVNGTFVSPSSAPGKTAADCNVCPAGTNTTIHAGYRACSCLANFSRTDRFGPCQSCDASLGMQCDDDYLSVLPGFWWSWHGWDESENASSSDENLYAEFVKSLTTRDDTYSKALTKFTLLLPKINPCPINESCTSTVTRRIRRTAMCAEGYEGTLCGQCSDNYYTWFQRCKKCPEKWRTALQIVFLVVLLGVLAAVLYAIDRLRNSRDDLMDQISSALKIIVGFVQVMSAVFDVLSYVPWPRALLSIGHFMKLLELNIIAVATPTCLNKNLRFNALMIPIFKFACQLALLLSIWAYYKARRRYLISCSRDRDAVETKISKSRTSCMRNSWWILFISYPSTAASIMATFPYKDWTCMKVCLREANSTSNGTENSEDCRWLLKEDYSVVCNYSMSTALWILCWALLAYVIILPALLFVGLEVRRRKTLPDAISKKYAFVSDFVKSLRFLDSNYKSEYWYWEVVEIGRKFFLTVGMGFFGRQSHSGIALAMLLATLFLVLHAQLKPIKRSFGHWLQQIALGVISINLMMGTLVLLSFTDEQDPGYNSLVDQKAFSAIVVAANSVFLFFVAGRVLTVIVTLGKKFVKSERWKNRRLCSFKKAGAHDSDGERSGLLNSS
ncbi:uncharacterized protein [Oscarella lobularis]|uniref:uncharacterized protein n=1 Tax=Oscarella lobularis TaxID=121494 RepID=UPI0033142A1F